MLKNMNRQDSLIVLLFGTTSFLSASLIFLCQPMISKLLLPLFGGSPAVWNASVVFFQAALLLGYIYAHWSVKKLGIRLQPLVHAGLILIPVVLLPFALPEWTDPSAASEAPIPYILFLLCVIVGIPFAILSTIGSLLQYWFASTTHPLADKPYFLYAISNLGSFTALLAYPFLVEPALALSKQSALWRALYLLLVGLLLGCIFITRKFQGTRLKPTALSKVKPLAVKQKALWVFVAFIPSSLMLGVTTYITTDIASTPLFWIIPLALYLLTFVVAFGVKAPEKLVAQLQPVAAGLLAISVFFMLPMTQLDGLGVIVYPALFVAISLIAHGKLAASKPKPAHLTEFYLWVAVGGMLGGLFNGIIAPIIFNDVYEFHLVLLLSVGLLVGGKALGTRMGSRSALWYGLSLVLFLVVFFLQLESKTFNISEYAIYFSIALLSVCGFILQKEQPAKFAAIFIPLLAMPIFVTMLESTILTERTFFGVMKIRDANDKRVLLHGTTTHGDQSFDEKQRRQPSSYYSKEGPLGDIVQQCRQLTGCHSIGAIGLGTGTLAAYGNTGDAITFFEIDPAMVTIAKDPKYFSYVSDSKASVDYVIGDGRLALSQTNQKYDLLVVDAFSSDAIPVHLLTAEAMTVYKNHLTDDGLIAVHISNRYLNLEPIVQSVAAHAGLETRIRIAEGSQYSNASQWVAAAKEPGSLQAFPNSTEWHALAVSSRPVWRDDFSNIFDAIRW